MASAVIGALRVTLGLNSAAFSKGLKNSDTKLKNFGRNVAKGMKLVGVAAAAAATGVGLAVRGVLNEADKMAKVSQKIGIPIDELSRLKHAADLSGVSFEGMQTGLRRLSQNMNDAANGVGEGREAFERLGISVTNADGSLKSSSQVMQEMAAGFAEMPDGAEKTALAMDLMGRSGADMIPMLNGGKDALASMMAEADALGIVFDEKTGEAAQQFNDNLTRLSASIKGLVVQLTAALAPTLAAITDTVVRVVDGFKLLSPSTQKFIGIAAALTAGLTVLAIPLAALVISFGAISLPVTAAVVAVGALTAAVVAFWPEIQKAGQIVAEFVASIPGLYIDAIKQMAQIGRDLIAGLWRGIQERWESVKQGITDLASGVADRFKSILRIQSPSRVMMEIGGHITDGLAIGMSNGKNGVLDVAGNLSDGISGIFEGIGNGIASAIAGTKSWASVAMDAVKSVAAAALSAWAPTSGLGSIFKGLFGGLIGGLPSFAGGGFTGRGARSGGIDGKGGFLAINHPNETVLDHTKGQMGGSTYAPTINIDGRGADQSALARVERNVKSMMDNQYKSFKANERKSNVRGVRA